MGELQRDRLRGAGGPGHVCPSDLALDAWRAGVGTAGERQHVADALAACPECRDRAAALDAARESYLDDERAAALEARLAGLARERGPRAAPFWRRWGLALGGAGLVAAAAAALLLVVPPEGPGPADPAGPGARRGTVALKGGPLTIETFVRRGESVLRSNELPSLQAGDALGFRVTVGSAGWLAVFGTDAGDPVAIVPPGGEEALHVPAGEATQLPASAVLDAVGSEERFAVVMCPQPFRMAAAREALASWARSGDDGEAAAAVRRTVASDCTLRLLSFPKQ